MRKHVLLSIFAVVLLLSFVALAYCNTRTFTVPRLTDYTTTLSLNQNDYITGSIVVEGGVSNAINF